MTSDECIISKIKYAKPISSYTKTVNTAGSRKYVQGVIRSIWQVKHVTMALQSPTPPTPILWPLGLRNEPGVNREWTRSGAAILRNFQSPLTLQPWPGLASVTPAAAGAAQRALLGRKGRVNTAMYTFITCKHRGTRTWQHIQGKCRQERIWKVSIM